MSHAGFNGLEIARYPRGGQWSLRPAQRDRRCRGSCSSSSLVVAAGGHHRASTRPTRCSTSPTCGRSGSTATSRSRTSTGTSTTPASRARRSFHETFLERTTETGRRINFATIGCALLWSPFYAAADAWVQIANLHGARLAARRLLAALRRGGRLRVGVLWAAGPAAVGAGGEAAVGALAQARARVPWLPAVLVWIGTPLLFYMYIAPPMSHATSAFAVALFVVIWLRVRDDWSAGRARRAWRGCRADGDGARAGRVFRRRPGHRLPPCASHAPRRQDGTALRTCRCRHCRRRGRPSRRRRWPTSPSTATSGRRDWSPAR